MDLGKSGNCQPTATDSAAESTMEGAHLSPLLERQRKFAALLGYHHLNRVFRVELEIEPELKLPELETD